MIRFSGEIKGHSRPIARLTSFNAVQGWHHDGHLRPHQAAILGHVLIEWARRKEPARAVRKQVRAERRVLKRQP